jgi:anaerobic ribonucleoside-triphosphate reductase activating protein
MLAENGGIEVEVKDLVRQIHSTEDIEGITFVGGEPFAQPDAVAEICRECQTHGLSVMVFTGFTLDELEGRSNPAIQLALDHTDLLVDGPFVQGQVEQRRRWIGSANQGLHFLSDRYQPLDPVFWADNTVEIRFDGREISVNGWPLQSMGGNKGKLV